MAEAEEFSKNRKLGSQIQRIPEYFYYRPMQSNTLHSQSSKTINAWYIALLVSVKLCSSFSVFLLANFINTKLSHTLPFVANSRYMPSGALLSFGPMVQIVTFIQIGSGLTFIIILNVLKLNTLPTLGKESFCRDTYWVHVIIHSCLSTLLLVIRLGGLQLCGPFRASFVGSYYDMTLAGLVGALILRSRSKWLWQGVALFAVGIVLEYAFDDSHLDHLNEPGHLYTNIIGLTLLLLFAFLNFGFQRTGFTQNLMNASGGSIQLHSVSTFVSGVALVLISVFELMTSGDMIFFHVLPLSFIVIFGFVLDFYVDVIMLRKLDSMIVARVGTTASYFSAFIFVLVLSRIGTAAPPGLVSLISFGLTYIATFCLTSGNCDRMSTSIQYASSGDGLPRFNSDQSKPLIAQMDLSSQKSNSHTSVLIA